MKVKPEVLKAYDKIKIHLMMLPDTLSYSFILFSLKQVWSDDIPTAATNGKYLKINPDFFEKLTTDERIGLILHEISHVLFQHMTRLGTRNPSLFNQAGDYIINGLWIKKGYTMPAGALYDPDYDKYNTEQLYEILYKAEKQKGNDPDNDAFGIPGTGSDLEYPAPGDVKEVAGDVADIVLRAVTQAKQSNSAGNMPGEVLIELDKKINPKLPWRVIYANFMTAYAKDDYSLRKPNRRYMPDFYLPSLYSEAVMNMVFAVDSSGSVEDHEFSYFIKAIHQAQSQLSPEKMTVIDFDTRIKAVHTITQSVNILTDIKFSGRGGTNIREIIEWGNKNKPTVMTIFTDGEFYMPDEKPKFPIIWLIHGDYNFQPGYGRVIHYDIDN